MKMRKPLLLPIAFTLAITAMIQSRYDLLFVMRNTTVDAPKSVKYNRRFDPFVNRWHNKFYANDRRGGYLFFKHIRKAGGTTLRSYLAQVLKYHDSPRTAADFINNVKPEHINDQFIECLQTVVNLDTTGLKLIHSTIRNASTTAARNERANMKHQVHFAEQEFTAMDWECHRVDPRWKNTLSVIMLRHPIERHLSEFFYSGPGNGLDAKKVFVKQEYAKRVKNVLRKELPRWLKETGRDKRSFTWYLGRHYTDNFQLRALAGCAQDSCLDSEQKESSIIKTQLQTYLNKSFTDPDGACTMYFNEKNRIFDLCHSASPTRTALGICPEYCDGPCRYPVSAWGPVGQAHLPRAMEALNAYDVVFLTETLNDNDQSAFLADVMGVPRNSTFSLQIKNTNTEKHSEREKTHFYRDLLSNLTLDDLNERIREENALEIKLFEYAEWLNREMVRQWKKESGWVG